MKILFFLFIFLLIHPAAISAQQIIDSLNIITSDNLSDNNLSTADYSGTLLSGKYYKEYPPKISGPQSNGWWTNNGSSSFGGGHRRASLFGSGDLSGCKAAFAFDVPIKDYYLVYHHLQNSPNSSFKVLTKFLKKGEENPVKHFYHNQRNNNLQDGKGSWYPLGIIESDVGDSSFTVEFGIDTASIGVLRVDAVRLLRSVQQGADIEFGNRRSDITTLDAGTGDIAYSTSFYRERAPLDFPQTIFKWNGYTERTIPFYNLGKSPLIISGFYSGLNRFSISTPLPVVVQPGGEVNLTIRFSPLGEELTIDTIVIINNDVLEPEAKLPVTGDGINYNFIMNASVGGTEQHWNAPDPGYEDIGIFLASAPSPFHYPIPNGNLKSVVCIDGSMNASVLYKFTLPDSQSGNYIIEYSGPAGSSSSTEFIQADIVTPGYLSADTALADTQRAIFNPRPAYISSINYPWIPVGDDRTFELNGGGQTKIILRKTQPFEFLRADLLRIKLAAVLPIIKFNIDSLQINFDSVSVVDSVRILINNYQKILTINSLGELPLNIDTIYFSAGKNFQFNEEYQFPFSLPAIDGKLDLEISFLPDQVNYYSDTLFIKSNDKHDSLTTILLNGIGIENIVGIYSSEMPLKYSLEQNHPNPFNPVTEIKYSIPEQSFVVLKIYDILGSEVKSLIASRHDAGKFKIQWNGRNDYGVSVSSGMYIYRITAGKFVQTKKMIFLK